MVNLLTYILVSIYGGIGGYTIGISRMANSSINDKLVSIHASEISNILLQGGGGYALFGKVIMGGTGYGGSIRKTGDSITVKYGIGGGYFEAGYIPLSLKFVYPAIMLGIGGYSEQLVISKNIRRFDWDGIWQNPESETELTHGGFSISPSFALLIATEKMPVGILIKATYNTILSKKWEFEDGTSLSSYPDAPLGTFSFTLTVFTGGIKNGK